MVRNSSSSSHHPTTDRFNDEDPSNNSAGASSEPVPLTTVHHNMNDANDASRGNRPQQQQPRSLMFGMSRVALAGTCVLGMVAAGVAAYTSMEVVPKNQEMRDLEQQVNRLTQEVNRLEAENDRFETSNDMLNSSIAEFRLENQQLNETKQRLDQSIVDLNETIIPQLQQTNDDLADIVAQIRQDLETLNQTVIQPLGASVQQMNATVTALFANTDIETYNLLNDVARRIARLNAENARLTELRDDLNDTVAPLRAENDRLRNQLEALEGVAQVLGDTTDATAAQVQAAAEQLTSSILRRRELGMARPRLQRRDTRAFWDCRLGAVFPNLMTNNPNTTLLTEQSYTNVMDNIQANVLIQLCLDRNDLELYLQQQYGDGNDGSSSSSDTDGVFTMNEIIQGVNDYLLAAMEYFHPSPNNSNRLTTITPEQWERVNYECQNLPTFLFEVS